MAGERLGECRAQRVLTPAHLLQASPRGWAERRERGREALRAVGEARRPEYCGLNPGLAEGIGGECPR